MHHKVESRTDRKKKEYDGQRLKGKENAINEVLNVDYNKKTIKEEINTISPKLVYTSPKEINSDLLNHTNTKKKN